VWQDGASFDVRRNVSIAAAHLYRNGKNAKAVALDEPIDCKGNPSLPGSDYSTFGQNSSNLRRTMGFTHIATGHDRLDSATGTRMPYVTDGVAWGSTHVALSDLGKPPKRSLTHVGWIGRRRNRSP
jgi:hypothetical protein